MNWSLYMYKGFSLSLRRMKEMM